MTKKIITALLALTMLFMTACGEDNSTDTSKADTTTTTSVTEQTEDSSSDSEDTTTTTTTTTQETTTTTTAETSKKEEKTTTTKATTKATTTTKQAVATTTTQAYTYTQATTKATAKPVQTTKATTKATSKATTKATTKATVKPANKSALDLAYEAVILGTSTKAQRDLICNDLNNYVISKGYSKKLDKSLYALSDANGKPTEDITQATDWGNCGYNTGTANDTFTTSYRLGSSSLETARENYKAKLKAHIDYDTSFLSKTYNKPFSSYKFNVVIYKDYRYAELRTDLANKYKTPRFVMVFCYAD